eukprot:5340633-Amphidinium_carterae.2
MSDQTQKLRVRKRTYAAYLLCRVCLMVELPHDLSYSLRLQDVRLMWPWKRSDLNKARHEAGQPGYRGLFRASPKDYNTTAAG